MDIPLGESSSIQNHRCITAIPSRPSLRVLLDPSQLIDDNALIICHGTHELGDMSTGTDPKLNMSVRVPYTNSVGTAHLIRSVRNELLVVRDGDNAAFVRFQRVDEGVDTCLFSA